MFSAIQQIIAWFQCTVYAMRLFVDKFVLCIFIKYNFLDVGVKD